MSALHAQQPSAVRTPAALDLPLPAQIDAVLPALREEAAKLFVRELLEALADAKRQDDLRPLQDVVEAWYRSLLFVREGLVDRLDSEVPAELEEEPLTIEDVKGRLGV